MRRLREDATAIWRAGLSAVDSAAVVRRVLSYSSGRLSIAGRNLDVSQIGRVEVLGAGKAGAGMARGFEQALEGTPLCDRFSGWVNVPEDCVLPLRRIHLHPARPPGRNEPTSAVVRGTEEILRRARGLRVDDVCVVLLSGGGSALLCSPESGISLEDKLAVTRLLSASGAPIQELNLVRTQLSRVKGGGLAEACGGGLLITLVISDVIGDPLDVIGSGPTYPAKKRCGEAVEILRRRGVWGAVPSAVRGYLEQFAITGTAGAGRILAELHHEIVASNSIALDAAAVRARELGYVVLPMLRDMSGEAAEAGRRFWGELVRAGGTERVCLLGGGETTVNVSSAGDRIGRGGRNQEFVLAVAEAAGFAAESWQGRAILSGGTDGEDGPTVAAGAWCDGLVADSASEQGLVPREFLERHDSYSFFERTDGLLITGPTQTNVMDLVVGLSSPESV